MKAQLVGFGIGSSGQPQTTARAALNYYFEPRPPGEKSTHVVKPYPGLSEHATINGGTGAMRCIHTMGTVAFIVCANKLIEVDSSGTATTRGTLASSGGRVEAADNGATMILVDGTKVYTYVQATATFTTLGGGTCNDGACSATWLGGYFVVGSTAGGAPARVYISADGSTWSSTDYASAESNPDALVAVRAVGNNLVVVGEFSTEFWTQTGAADYPFQPVVGSTLPYGSPAIEGTAVVRIGQSVYMIGQSRGTTAPFMLRIRGYQAERISNPDFERVLRGYALSSSRAFAFELDGHEFYQITFVSASATWVYDALTGIWTKLDQFGAGATHFCGFGLMVPYAGGLAANTILGLANDSATGKVYKYRPDLMTEDGSAAKRELILDHVAMPDLDKFTLDEVRMDVSGSTAFTHAMSVSRNGGYSWGSAMASRGDSTNSPLRWARLGTARQFTLKFSQTVASLHTINNIILNPKN